jgi:pyruvate,orthophosphate dikinase
MSNLGFNIPPGVTVSTHASEAYALLLENIYNNNTEKFLEALAKKSVENLSHVKEHFGYNPLYSVRSGAAVSMPGMMDTVLNVGIHKGNMDEWSDRIGEKATWDCYNRLLMTIATSIYGVSDKTIAEIEASVAKFKYGAKESPASYSDFSIKHFQKMSSKLEKHLDAITSEDISNLFFVMEGKKTKFSDFINSKKNPLLNQFALTIKAVLDSWNSDRAKSYREINDLKNLKGTAINIQAMVFGNLNDNSCSGVLFTRNPTTGEKEVTGEYLTNAQGEDVVSGTRTPKNIEEMKVEMPDMYSEIIDICHKMEYHFKDMMDIEFTVQDGQLFILQSRSGKRSTQAKFVIALDMLDSGVIDKRELRNRVKVKEIEGLISPSVSTETQNKNFSVGTPASGGVVSGEAVFSSDDAVELKEEGRTPILFAFSTTPDDIDGINASAAIVTQIGGVTSHAAVVARGMNKTCIVGVNDMDHNRTYVKFHDSNTTIKKGDKVVVDGNTGKLYFEKDVKIEKGGLPEKIANIFYKKSNESQGFYLNINDEYLNSLELNRIRTKMFVRIKPHHINEKTVDMIENLAEKLGRTSINLDISSLAMEDHVQKNMLSDMLNLKGERSYNKKNLLRFNKVIEDFSLRTNKHTKITVVSGNKKIEYAIHTDRSEGRADVNVVAHKQQNLEHLESVVFG